MALPKQRLNVTDAQARFLELFRETFVYALAADAKLLDKSEVPLTVALGDVTQQTAALTDQLEQSATGHKVVLVGLEVLGQLLDALGHNGDLR